MLPLCSPTHNALGSVSWIQYEVWTPWIGVSPYFVQITIKTLTCVERLGNTWVCLQWSTYSTASLCCWLDLAKFSLLRAHARVNTPISTRVACLLQQTHTQEHVADRHPSIQIIAVQFSPACYATGTENSSSQTHRGAKVLWCYVELLWGAQLLCAPSSSLGFSSGHPRLCHLAARWLRQDLPGPSASGNAR